MRVPRLGGAPVLNVDFGAPITPAYVKLRYISFKVYPYIDKHLRCLKCYHYGHMSGVATKPLRALSEVTRMTEHSGLSMPHGVATVIGAMNPRPITAESTALSKSYFSSVVQIV